jgi:hypothetical protein
MTDHGCRTYWGHCGCDLPRGHGGPHVGLHWPGPDHEPTKAYVQHPEAHVMQPGTEGSEHIFGEDSGNE